VQRRLRGTSSGDDLAPRWPVLTDLSEVDVAGAT
jgi:hypothetical protein